MTSKTAMSYVWSLSASLVALWTLDAPACADTWPASVRAVYEVNLNGFNIGSFEFQSEAESQSYTLSANARFSLLLGAFTWNSETRSFGLIVNEAPKPASFSFDYKSSVKAGSTKVGFSDGIVTNVKQQPPIPAKRDTIPLREQHLKGVLDPLSAVMVLSRGPSTNPCDRRLPIFDGKERFDLVFTYKRQMTVAEHQSSGLPGIAYVCRVKYMPIAGHESDREASMMASSDAIEVALRPVPSANVFVPYMITIPTIIGSATIISKRIDIASPGKPQIAISN
jgi:hypothetical protein